MRKRRNRKGRTTKYNDRVVRHICRELAQGVPLKYAAALAGISESTCHQWRKDIPQFSESIEEAIAKGVSARIRVINAAARKGNVRAAMWWLEHVMAEWFSPNRLAQKASSETDTENRGDVTIYLPSNGMERYLNQETGEWEPVKYPKDSDSRIAEQDRP